MRELLKRAAVGAAGLALLASLSALPATAAPKAAASAAPAGAKVDLNAASEKELEALPGVGKATARKIIAGRPYSSVADLARAGVSAKVIAQITPQVTAGAAVPAAAGSNTAASAGSSTTSPPPMRGAAGPRTAAKRKADLGEPGSSPSVDLNTASEKELRTLPGVGVATARKIIANRPYATVEDLMRAGVPAATIAKLVPLVRVSPASSGAMGSTGAPASPPPPPPPSRSTSPAPATSSAPAAPSATAPATAAAGSSAGAAAQPPVKGMVWVNLDSKIYHFEGDRFYGKTKHGQFMSEADAVKAGYRASKRGPKSQ